MAKYLSRLVAASLTMLTAFALAPVVRADIFQWEYINPADPSQGKQPSTTLCPDGAGAYVGPAANLSNRNLTMAYLIGAELSADVVTDFEGNVMSYAVADLSGANLSGADAQGAHFYFAKLTGANLSGANLKNVSFWDYPYWAIPGADLTNANLSGTDARGTNFGVATLTGANFTDAQVRGANFIFSGFTAAQLYSTASYQAHDLSVIKLSGNYAGLDLAGQNLTNATFYIATLSGANLSQANLTNSDFSSYSTGIADLTGANLSQANLTNANFRGYESEDGILPGANLTDANLSGADARGANFDFATLSLANTSNLIRSNGHVSGLDLTAGASLVVRDYDGKPAAAPPSSPLPIVVDQRIAMDATGTLRLVFDADPWDSTISFAPGIPVTLGGTLELNFAAGVNVAAQSGRTVDLFDWAGVTPMGAFNVVSPNTWDLSKLYSTGEVTLTTATLPFADFNGDSIIDGADLASWRAGFGTRGNATRMQGDADGDLDVDESDFLVWQRQLDSGVASAAVPEPDVMALMILAAPLLIWRRRRRVRARQAVLQSLNRTHDTNRAPPSTGPITATPKRRTIGALTLALLLTCAAHGQDYTFLKIAETTPGGAGGGFYTFGNVAPSVNAAGTVAFQAAFVGGAGIYTGAGGPITTVVETSGPTFASFSGTPLLNAAGTVAFFASRHSGEGGGTGIFTSSGGATTNIALSGAAGGGLFTGFGSTPSINAAGTVVFWADRNSDLFPKGPGIFTGNGGGLTTIVQHNDSDFRGIGDEATINDAGTVAFRAGVAGTSFESGIFTRNGEVTKQIVQANLPGTGTIFNGGPGTPSINATGKAAFLVGNSPEGRGIYFGSGGQPLNMPDSGNPGSPTTLADSRGAFTNQISGVMSINAAGTIVFFGGLDAGGAGLFTGPDPVADKVISVGDSLFGSTVSQLFFGRQGLNDAGQVAFHYQLADGQQGIALSAVREPSFLEGDFDEDSDVDGDDLARWRTGFGIGATHMQGDANADQDVDGSDFLIWQRQLGGAALAASPATVPEPSAGILLLMGYAAARVIARGRSLLI